MKKFLVTCLLALFAAAASAQTVALGERVPDLRIQTWLGGQQPTEAQLTYIEFFQPSNSASVASLENLQGLSRKLGTKLHVVVVSREKDSETVALLTPFVSEAMSVGIDPSGRAFTAFGIRYVPAGVLVDAKRKALWMGNSRQVDERLLRKFLN